MFEFFHKLNVAVACRSTMYTLQSVFVNPIVYTYWNSMRQALMEKFRMSGKPINISGDGQFDSPGFNARYCFYSVIEATTNKVLDFYVADKSQTEYSSRMEPFATKMLLARLYKEKIEVKVCTTDRSGQLKSLMKEVNEARKQKGLTPIKHTFDVWHYVKAVIKDIYTASKLKKCAALAGWSRSIKNMLWYSFSECKGDADLLREMILSIPLHVSGVHFFPQNRLFQRCLHGDLSTERAKPWLKAGSLSMRKLVLALRGPRDCRFKDLAYMTEFQHTGTNESLNALHNVYLRKSTAFGHPQAIVRACLTSIDHNSNAERQLALDVDGDERYTISSTRDGQTYTAKAIKEPKDTTWRDTILDEVVQVDTVIFFISIHDSSVNSECQYAYGTQFPGSVVFLSTYRNFFCHNAKIALYKAKYCSIGTRGILRREKTKKCNSSGKGKNRSVGLLYVTDNRICTSAGKRGGGRAVVLSQSFKYHLHTRWQSGPPPPPRSQSSCRNQFFKCNNRLRIRFRPW
jgi:transposase-like protein